MTFLAPALLMALPLAVLPVAIHLIHLYRRRQVPWAAMMFLRAAQRMNKGLSRLRQVLILSLRVLAVAALLFVLTRPLAGGWLGLTGGAPETVLVLLDRSASMEQQNPVTGLSKRAAGLQQMAKAINDAVGTRSRLVLIESAGMTPLPLVKADALNDLPQTEATDTAADVPGMLQAALDYITANHSGRTDVWLLSDLQRSDWDASGGRWAPLRAAFASLQGVRFHLLCYPQAAADDLGIKVERVTRRETAEQAELLLDLRVTWHAEHPQPVELPLRFTVNGAATTVKVKLVENELVLQGYALPIDKAVKRGWGRVELPHDSAPFNDAWSFAFDEPAPLRSVIVSDDAAEAAPLQAALSAAADPARKYEATVLPVARVAEIPWDDTALVVWQAPVPAAESGPGRRLQEMVSTGRSVLFLPPETPDAAVLFGLHWEQWETGNGTAVEWWRNDSDLLARTRDGAALPVGTLEVTRRCGIGGEGVPLAQVAGHAALLMRTSQPGNAWFLGTLPGAGSSSLARDGVVLFVALQRALEAGAQKLGRAQQRAAGPHALGGEKEAWHSTEEPSRMASPLRAGVAQAGERQVALNRPVGEDQPEVLSPAALNELFAGLDFRVITGTLEDSRSLTNEVWRTFLLIMAAALLGEALLCLPPRRARPVTQPA